MNVLRNLLWSIGDARLDGFISRGFKDILRSEVFLTKTSIKTVLDAF